MLKILRFLSLALTAVATGVAAGHVLQMPGKAKLSGPVFLDVQQVLLRSYGKALGLIEAFALLATGAVVLCVRRDRSAFLLTFVAAACNTAMITVWAALIRPINEQVDRWTPESLPQDWTESRDRWHVLHAARAALAGVALAALIYAALRDSASSQIRLEIHSR